MSYIFYIIGVSVDDSADVSVFLFGRCFGRRPLYVHLYDLLDVLDLVHELHLCHPPTNVLELPDRPDHTQQKEKQMLRQIMVF